MHPRTLIASAILLAAASTAVNAALVTGPWLNADTVPAGGQGNGPITNGNTASPIVGDGTANSADGEMIDSVFPAITLSDGDKIVFTGSVTLTGTVNSAASSGTPRTQFRFGLFDGDEVAPDDNGWVGYLMTNSHGNGTPGGSLTRKPVGNTSVYLSTTGGNSLAATNGNGSVFNDDTYALSMTIERVGANLAISGSITGTATTNFSQSLSATDTAAATLGTYTFDHLGFLMGGNLDTDQATFSNLDVTYVPIPEPTTASLLVLSALPLLRRSRRA